jgi:ABC-type lipoprotein release transport system permease subunit
MGTPLHIALRYLFAKKSHNVINIISIISAAGIAIGSMALILILSVYNGFDNSIREIYESYKADFVIAPTKGKLLTSTEDNVTDITGIKGIMAYEPILEENVFLKYGNRDAIVTIRGIQESYLNRNHIAGNIVEGEAKTSHGEIRHAIIGQQLARTLGLRVRFVTPIEVYFPNKKSTISITNPLESLNYTTLFPSAVVKADGEENQDLLYAGTEVVRELTNCSENEYTSVEVYTEGVSSKQAAKIQEELQRLFPNCSVKDKQQQNSTLYKMMKAEKFAVYLILFFVIAIISVNIFSSLSMLITDKKEDIETFLSLGAPQELVKKIFHLHGALISVTGCTIGIAAGTLLALVQQYTGIITIPGNYLISAYPVDIQVLDILITFVGVSGTGFLISRLPLRKLFTS